MLVVPTQSTLDLRFLISVLIECNQAQISIFLILKLL